MSRKNVKTLNVSIQSAVRTLRAHFGESQEAFARRVARTTRTVARWERTAPPTGQALVTLFELADREGLLALAAQFRRFLEADINIPLRENWLEIQLSAGSALRHLEKGDLNSVRQELHFIMESSKQVLGQDFNLTVDRFPPAQ